MVLRPASGSRLLFDLVALVALLLGSTSILMLSRGNTADPPMPPWGERQFSYRPGGARPNVLVR